MKLDLTDRKILYELDGDCRQSISLLAKKLKIHRNVALYRIKQLEKEKIILGYYTEINTTPLGYFSFRVFLKLSNSSKEQENEIINFIASEKKTIWFFQVLGIWDLDFVIAVKEVSQFNEFLEQLILKFNSIIETKQIALLTTINRYPKDYLLNDKRADTTNKTILSFNDQKIDKEDMNILKIISNNANMHILELAKKTSLSVNTIKKRIKDLKKKQVILGYRIFINTAKIGYTYYKVHVNLREYNQHKKSEFLTFLETKSNIVYISKYINGDDFEIELHLPTQESIINFLQEIKEKYGNILKETFNLQFYKEIIFRYFPE